MSQAQSLLMTAQGLDETQSAFDALTKCHSPEFGKILYGDVKFDDYGRVTRRNIEGLYPSATAELQTLTLAFEDSMQAEVYYRLGYDIFCLNHALQIKDAGRIVFLSGIESNIDWKEIEVSTQQDSLTTRSLGLGQIVFLDGGDIVTREAVFLASELLRTGAALSFDILSIGTVLDTLRQQYDCTRAGLSLLSEHSY